MCISQFYILVVFNRKVYIVISSIYILPIVFLKDYVRYSFPLNFCLVLCNKNIRAHIRGLSIYVVYFCLLRRSRYSSIIETSVLRSWTITQFSLYNRQHNYIDPLTPCPYSHSDKVLQSVPCASTADHKLFVGRGFKPSAAP